MSRPERLGVQIGKEVELFLFEDDVILYVEDYLKVPGGGCLLFVRDHKQAQGRDPLPLSRGPSSSWEEAPPCAK